jgi:hypothetical protein
MGTSITRCCKDIDTTFETFQPAPDSYVTDPDELFRKHTDPEFTIMVSNLDAYDHKITSVVVRTPTVYTTTSSTWSWSVILLCI